MFKRYLRFNIKLFPLYLGLAFMLMIAIFFGEDGGKFLEEAAIAIVQLSFIVLIPNIVYMFRHRRESGSLIGLLGMIPVIPVPFVLIAILLKVLYV
ncbi:hypothetical protein AS034_13605 [[Bacillus] enclensis]|uniref:Uncharacterized protein n=1 Tax=[Bacillus] enclensis TaxID=1402860 RepID=A0A0V8HGW3_9BACI|nr:hypothetical protein [[Bacillus] enclensis]KSU61859.1 hypothetical protein AS034_13605 [[Bacillus] enclensis]SCC16287.1 hypothetical protein GA0061094_2810 [[Bacillus] enclensis]